MEEGVEEGVKITLQLTLEPVHGYRLEAQKVGVCMLVMTSMLIVANGYRVLLKGSGYNHTVLLYSPSPPALFTLVSTQ